jgi:hypothetical protein
MTYMFYFFLFLLQLSVAVCPAFAQKEELAFLVNAANDRIQNRDRLHLEYAVMVRATSGGSEIMQMHLYKSEDRQRLQMGEVQEVLREGKRMILVNHLQKIITYQEDSAEVQTLPIQAELSTLLDSAASVKKIAQGDLLLFELTYSNEYIPFNKVIISFLKKSGLLRSIRQEFVAGNPEGYSLAEITYHHWDNSWKPEAGFPHMDKYLLSAGKTLSLQEPWKGYNLFKPQRGTLKF